MGIIALAVGLALLAPSAFAAEDVQVQPLKTEPTVKLIGKKLRRGAANASLGWLEVPAGVQEIGNQHGVGAAATWGLLHGTGRAVQRTAVGLFEILTFPFALTQDYKPIIEPEFVLDRPKAEPAAPAEAAPQEVTAS